MVTSGLQWRLSGKPSRAYDGWLSRQPLRLRGRGWILKWSGNATLDVQHFGKQKKL